MHALLIGAALFNLGSPAASAQPLQDTKQDKIVTETIVVQNSEPTYLLRFLVPLPNPKDDKLPIDNLEGIKSYKVDDLKRTVTVTGTAAAIAELRQRFNLLDVILRSVKIMARVLQTVEDQSGKRDVRIVNEVVFTAQNNSVTSFTFPHWSRNLVLTLRPRVNGDNSISYSATLKVTRDPLGHGDVGFVAERTINRRVPQGKAVYFGAFPDSSEHADKGPIFSGTVEDPKEKLGYYLELSTEILKNN